MKIEFSDSATGDTLLNLDDAPYVPNMGEWVYFDFDNDRAEGVVVGRTWHINDGVMGALITILFPKYN